MIDVKNKEKQNWINNRFHDYIGRLSASNKKAPANPGAGWLAAKAAEQNLCTATLPTSKEDVMLCGVETDKNPYYCNHHAILMQNQAEKMKATWILSNEKRCTDKQVEWAYTILHSRPVEPINETDPGF